MVEPVGFVEAWRAQFPESSPPIMALSSVGDIEQELEKCKSSIRLLETEVNKERFRMIYLQTLLAKERKSYDRQRWGFKRTSQLSEEGQPSAPEALMPTESNGGRCSSAKSERPLAQEYPEDETPVGQPKANRHTHRGEINTHQGMGSSWRPAPAQESEVQQDSSLPERLGVAALRSNFERLRKGEAEPVEARSPARSFYVNMEYHEDRGLIKVNNRDVSEKISGLGTQAMQMERLRSLATLAGTQSGTSVDGRRRVMHRRSSQDSAASLDRECEDPKLIARSLKDNLLRPDGAKAKAEGSLQGGQQAECQPLGQPPQCQPYTSVFVGGLMGDEEEAVVVWPQRSCSTHSFEDGYTPDCSSNENLTSSEEDFCSSLSSHVSPGTSAPRPRQDKSCSPSQNSQQSLESGSPPTPQPQQGPKQPRRRPGASITDMRNPSQTWPSDGDSTSSRTSYDISSHGDVGKCTK